MHCFIKGAWLECNKRNNIHNANARVYAGVRRNIKHGDGFTSKDAGGIGTRKREHTAVVVGIAVHIQQVWPEFFPQGIQALGVTAFADIDDAFKHPSCLSHFGVAVLP